MSRKKFQHDKEHQNWSRRQFLLTSGMASMSSLFLGNTFVQAANSNPLTQALSATDNDRILVFLNLFGGNDGLNTIVPYSSDAGREVYEMKRPSLKVVDGSAAHNYSSETLLSNFGTTDFAVPNSMRPIMDMWHTEKMAVIHNVGYPNQNLSHFISTQIWQTGADNQADDLFKSGIVGRQMEVKFPAFDTAPPSIPPAIQIGNFRNHLFNGADQTMGLIFSSPDSFYNVANTGNLYPTNIFDDCPQGDSRAFLRQVANNSNRYSQSIFDAYNRSGATNNVEYTETPRNKSQLDSQLSIIARLIKGNLGTKVYTAYGKNYDTHSGQIYWHPTMVGEVASNIRAFFDDLATSGLEDKVTLVVFSEFGRTIAENGSGANAGTDHGNTAPVLVFGGGINGGFYQEKMDLYKIATDGRFHFDDTSTDFRSVFATLFEEWLCISPMVVNYIMGGDYERIPNLITDPCTDSDAFDRAVLLGHHPGELPDTVKIKYALSQRGTVRLRIMDTSGQQLHTFFHEEKTAGSHVFSFKKEDYLLPSGEYIYQLDAGGKEYHQRMLIE